MTADADAGGDDDAAPGAHPPTSIGTNRSLVRFVASTLLGAVAEFGVLIGVLVIAYERGGEQLAGIASLVVLSPYLLLSSTTAAASNWFGAATIRTIALGCIAAAYTIAGLAALAEGPTALIIGAVTVGIAADTALRPAGAVVLPSIVRSSSELTSGNVWLGHAESASALGGPAVATALLALDGAGATLLGCAGFALVAAGLSMWDLRGGPAPTGSTDANSRNRLGTLVLTPLIDVAHVVRRPGAGAVLTVVVAQYVLVGSFDILAVVIALDHLELGDAGAGVLTALLGAGAVASMLVTGRAARRLRLAPMMLSGLVVIAATAVLLGSSLDLVVVCIALPVLGLVGSTIELLGRILLQRSAPPSELATVFGASETSAGFGLLVGSLLTQILIAIAGVTAALVGLAVVFVTLTLWLWRPLQRADASADVPVVAMSLLRAAPAFAALPTATLETVARSGVEQACEPGTVVVRQGDVGDRFYAIADGTFDVTVSDHSVRTLRRGDWFGEIALLADIPRTASVTAVTAGLLLAVERDEFLLAVTGHDPAHAAAWSSIRSLDFDGGPPPPVTGIAPRP